MYLSVFVIICAAAWARFGGLNPTTLWFDDLWVAALVKMPSLWDAVTAPAPAPPGFVLILWIVDKLTLDPEWGLQLIPYLAGLATIPVAGYLGRRITETMWGGLLAASLMALSPWVSAFSTAVKQYSLDALVTLLLLTVAVILFSRKASVRDFVMLAAATPIAFLFSVQSIFLSTSLLAVVALRLFMQSSNAPKTRARVWGVIGFHAAALAFIYLSLIQMRTTPALQGYWMDNFVPASSIFGVFEFLVTCGADALQGAMPYGWGWPVLLAVPGFVWLMSSRRWRPLGTVLLVFTMGLPFASYLKLYPMGGERTDIFVHPVVILLVTLGLHAVISRVTHERIRNYGYVLPAVTALCFAVFIPAVSNYPASDSEQAMATVLDAAGRRDQRVISMPAAQWLLAYYGPWDYDVVREPNSTTSYVIEFEEDGPIVLPFSGAQDIATALASAIEDRPRIVHIVDSDFSILPEVVDLMPQIQTSGYLEVRAYLDVRTSIRTFGFQASRDVATQGRT